MTVATVFGLDVHGELPLSFLQTAGASRTGRELDLSLVGTEPKDLDWPDGATLKSDQRHPDGEVSFQIEIADGDGYRIWGPLYGASVISSDGHSLRGTPGTGGMEAWQRLLVAQALPFVAVLRGLDVLHASAVVLDGGAIAFAGHSGAGKTSLAVSLWRRGADFLADDVLAVERRESELVGHPGAPVAGIHQAEADRLLAEGKLGGEQLDRNARELVVRMPLCTEPAPLRALFFIDRRVDGPAEPRFEPAPDPQLLLSSTFNLVLASPSRLEGLLDLCALVARQRVERIVTGPSIGTEELAAAVERRVEAAP